MDIKYIHNKPGIYPFYFVFYILIKNLLSLQRKKEAQERKQMQVKRIYRSTMTSKLLLKNTFDSGFWKTSPLMFSSSLLNVVIKLIEKFRLEFDQDFQLKKVTNRGLQLEFLNFGIVIHQETLVNRYLNKMLVNKYLKDH